MEKSNGVYRISCSVNGAKIKMIFDTGATSVSLSESMANFLYDNDYISKEDILGTSKSQMADGSIHDNVVINIKDIEIAGLHLKNVQAVVISSQNAPLLLGQSAIQKLGRITLNDDKLIINDYEGDYTDEELEKIVDDAEKYYNEENYYASADCWLKYLDYGELTTYGYFMFINSLGKTNQYDKVIKYGKEWEVRYRTERPSNYSSMIMDEIGLAYSAKGDTKTAITYIEKVASIDLELGNNPCFAYGQLAMLYIDIKDYDSAITYSKKELKGLFELYNTSERQINSGEIDNKLIGQSLYYYAISLYRKNDKSSGDYIIGLSAKCKYESAIEFCNEYNINYYSHQKLFE